MSKEHLTAGALVLHYLIEAKSITLQPRIFTNWAELYLRSDSLRVERSGDEKPVEKLVWGVHRDVRNEAVGSSIYVEALTVRPPIGEEDM